MIELSANDFGAGICLLAGTISVVIGVSLTKRTDRNARQVTVYGRIVHSEIAFNGDHYLPIVRFTYSYAGCDYEGETAKSPLVVYNFEGPARRFCERLPVGKEVEVLLDPADPSRAWLPGTASGLRPLLVISGTVLMTIAMLILWAK